MKTFRCPKCKYEIKETVNAKIYSVSCKRCRRKMVKLFVPSKKQLDLEKEMDKRFVIKE